MNTPARVFTFGLVGGLVWAVIAGVLDELFRSRGETLTVLTSGVMSGVAVSFILFVPLARFGRLGGVLLGIASLPLGAFVFGVLASVVQWLAGQLTGETYRFIAYGFTPWRSGAELALLSMISIFAFFLFPLAVLTTFLLRAILRLEVRPRRGT